MTNKIIELAIEIAHETTQWVRDNPVVKIGRKYSDVPSFSKLQAEVTRMEQELEAALKDRVALASENERLRVLLADIRDVALHNINVVAAYFSPKTPNQSFGEKYPRNPDAKCKCEHWQVCIDCHPTYVAAILKGDE